MKSTKQELDDYYCEIAKIDQSRLAMPRRSVIGDKVYHPPKSMTERLERDIGFKSKSSSPYYTKYEDDED